MKRSYTLDDQQHATVIAALRTYQLQGAARLTSDGIEDIATDAGAVEALDADGIGTLIEHLQFPPVPIDKPLTAADADEDEWIEGVVEMDLDEIMSLNFEGFMDALSVHLTGGDLLTNIHFKVVGHSGITVLLIQVGGNVDMMRELEEEDA